MSTTINTPKTSAAGATGSASSNAPLANRVDLNLLVWDSLDDAGRRSALRRPTQNSAAAVRLGVGKIVSRVRADGDAALRKFSRLLDRAALDVFEVTEAEFLAAEASLEDVLKAAIIDASERIDAFHRDSGAREYAVDTAPGVRCRRIVRPIARVGLYIPAGSAPLPSTMLMLGVPARIAGCEEVVVCTPPRADGTADPAVLFAARQCGVDRVFKLGGAQAIAAMAIGTESIPACDKLFGPGNAWVTEAKRQVSTVEGGPAIDMPAGPSEVLVIADGGANPAFVAADLLSQAEHGADSQVILLSDSDVLIAHVARALMIQLAQLPRAAIARESLAQSRLIRVASIADAFEVSNRYAPEHLILALRDPELWLDRVRAAGSVFLGDYAAEALGDYCSGTNHVLPTGGAARAWSGLSVTSFQTAISVQSVTAEGLLQIGPSAVLIAEAEGLRGHANAVSIRMAAVQAEPLR